MGMGGSLYSDGQANYRVGGEKGEGREAWDFS
jgi:hypothetical protein